jgi:hypothetical protein
VLSLLQAFCGREVIEGRKRNLANIRSDCIIALIAGNPKRELN